MEMPVPTSSEIRALRSRMEWSQQDVAILLDRSVWFIAKCEQGKNQLSGRDWHILRGIAAAEIDEARWPPPPPLSQIIAA